LIIDTKSSMEYVEDLIDQTNFKIEDSVRDLANKGELTDAIYKLDDKILDFKEKVAKDLTQFQEINNSIQDITSTMKKFAKAEEVSERFEEIDLQFNNYLKIDVFTSQKEEVDQITTICKKNISNFTIDNAKMKKIIQRFDEVILDKASKHKVKVLEDKFEFFLQKVDFELFKQLQLESNEKLNSQLESADQRISSVYAELFNIFDVSIKEMTPKIKDDVLEHLRHRVVDQNEFNSMMNLKVDKKDFERLNKIKANKIEYGRQKQTLAIFGSQLQHL
jgi:hypothetical protein